MLQKSPYDFECSKCHRVVDERSDKVWNKVEGYEKRREQGGTNYIAFRRPLPEYICGTCMEKMLAGDHPLQGVLFDK